MTRQTYTNELLNAKTNSLQSRSRRAVRQAAQRVVFENLEDRTLFSTFHVTNLNDSGAGSLRDAINMANAHAGADTIDFTIAQADPSNPVVQTISLNTVLGAITGPVTIDGSTEAGYAGMPMVEISGPAADGSAIGFEFTASAPGSIIEGLAVNGFAQAGIQFDGGADGSIARNNFVGTDATGQFAMPNGEGIYIEASNVTVTKNLLSGNSGDGVAFSSATGGSVTGNKIGADATGEFALGNLGSGVSIADSSGVIVGGNTADTNLISANAGNGVFLDQAVSCTVANNMIGVDATGSVVFDSMSNSLGNGGSGIEMDFNSASNFISANVIAASSGNGITVNNFASEPNTISGNYIGTDSTGTMALGNIGDGVVLNSGGATVTGNLISGNNGYGLLLVDGSTVTNNKIGADATGTSAVPNAADGIFIIGNSNTVDGNTIAFNEGTGVSVFFGAGNTIRLNSIFSNVGIGIDLGDDGATLNDSQPHDSGPNLYQNFPVIGAITRNASQLTINGTVSGPASSAITVDFYTNKLVDPSGYGQGEMYLGSVVVMTGSDGNASFSAMFSVTSAAAAASQQYVTATATTADGNTSEFSADAQLPALAATSTTLESSMNPSFYGQSVTFTASVTTMSGVLNNTITFYDGSTPVDTETVDANGKASLTLSSLGLGDHSFTAVYNGDAHHAASTSSALVQTIQPDLSQGSLSSSLIASQFGQKVTLTVLVTGPSFALTTPGGAVTLYDGQTEIGATTLDAKGKATWSFSTLGVGDHFLTAVYDGDNYFTGNTSNTIDQVVNKNASGILLKSSINPSAFGQNVDLTVSVTGPAYAPVAAGGMVTLYDGTSQLGATTLDAKGNATWSFSALAVGDHILSVVYSGDDNFLGGNSNIIDQSVVQATTSTSLTSSQNPSTFGQSVTFTATVSVLLPGMASPSGAVTFMDGNTVLGMGAVNNGIASLTLSTLSVGAHSITAVYSGDEDCGASASSALNQAVNAVGVTATLNSSVNPSVFGQSVTFTATVNSNAGTPGGSVMLYDGMTLLGTATLDGNGQATWSFSTLTVGDHSLTVQYAGNGTFLPATSPVYDQAVQKANTATTITSLLAPIVYGQSVTFTANVAVVGAGAGTPGGTVLFFDGATQIGSGTLDANGNASFMTSSLAVGNHSITANYIGATNYLPSVSAVVNESVGLDQSQTVLSSSANPSVFGQSVTITATVLDLQLSTYTPTGSVKFYDGATLLGTMSLTGGSASLVLSNLTVGTHGITAVYSGDTDVAGSTSAKLSQVVTPAASSISLSSSINPSVYGQNVTLTATVTSAAGMPGGSVIFYDGATQLGMGTLDANGHATFAISTLSVGSHSLTASYAGSASFQSSASLTLTQVVNKAATSTAISASSLTLSLGQSVTFTATVTVLSPGQATLSGAVTFYDGTTAIGAGTLNNGVATLTTSSLSAGSHSITASYAGDAHTAASVSSAVNPVVTASLASISGHVYLDQTGNGMSADDTAMSGVTIQIYLDNGNGSFDTSDRLVGSVVSGSNGAYTLGNLAAGRYFVQEITPAGYLRTLPTVSTYYVNVLSSGQNVTGDDFDNFKTCDCSHDISNLTFKDGCQTLTDLRGHTHNGDTVTATFTVLAGQSVTLSFVTYTAPDATFNANDAYLQKVYQSTTQTFTAGRNACTFTLSVKIPPTGHYQIDFVCGQVLQQLGQAGSNIFYTPQDRLFSADNE